MHLAVETGVPQQERKMVTAGLPHWDSARIFLHVFRCDSFRSAAERLRLFVNESGIYGLTPDPFIRGLLDRRTVIPV